jgi:hypothetical protein
MSEGSRLNEDVRLASSQVCALLAPEEIADTLSIELLSAAHSRLSQQKTPCFSMFLNP